MLLPHYEVRETIEFEPENSGLQANETLTKTPESDLTMGMNVVYNETETRRMHFAVNGRDESFEMKITGYRCKDYCKIEEVEEGEDTGPMLWSNPNVWKDHRIKYGRETADDTSGRRLEGEELTDEELL